MIQVGAKDPQGSGDQEIKVPEELALLPLKNILVFPRMISSIIVSDEKHLKLINDALLKDKILGLVGLKDQDAGEYGPENIYNVGTAALVLKMFKAPDGTVRLLVRGISRIVLKEISQTDPYLRARVSTLSEETTKDTEIEAMMLNTKSLFQKIVGLIPNLSPEAGMMLMEIAEIDNPDFLADAAASNLNITLKEKQDILETIDVKKRLEKVTVFLNRQLEILELGNKIQAQLKSEMSKKEREYYLREQLKAIQKELGEKDEKTAEIEELREKLKTANLPEQANKAAERELDRLSVMPPQAAEYSVSRTYLDWLVKLPWSISTEDTLDITAASRVLDEDHYDLEKVKKRLLEYLAVQKLKKSTKGFILCFSGPPGTGKTSLGKSIARALGRKFVRVSLGGVRDEAEIRGHRRTYVGALPGRIIQGLRKAGSNNPLFMLDEIDKMGASYQGDPSAALMEVLDPEQNSAFSDHYLEVDFDLSRVMFITTANQLEPIPQPLRDRMEVLELSGYTEEEKLEIATRFIIPRQLEEHGLGDSYLRFEDDGIKKIISDYTREAGLRNLEREIAAVCRGVAVEVVKGKTELTLINEETVSRFLGPIKFFSEIAERTSVPGVATGLAWTPSGGDILFIEATRMKGKKTLTLTGQLGDVMQESAQAALSYVRSRTKELGIPEDFYETSDIHLHVPAGATPKDGPSAGVTIFTALTSLLTGKPVRPDVAMTGEISLRGLVLPVGGIKEKILAAKRAGISTIILPAKNEKDLEDIPLRVRKEMRFHLVEKMDEVIEIALTDSMN